MTRRQLAAQMYTEGMSAREIGRELSVSHNTVSKYLRLEGVQLRQPVYPPKTKAKPRKREVETDHNIAAMMDRAELMYRIRMRAA